MKRFLALLLAGLLLGGLSLGCGQSDKDKGKNKDYDKPKPAGEK